MTSQEADVLLSYINAIQTHKSPPEVERIVDKLEGADDDDLRMVKKEILRSTEALRKACNLLVDVSNREGPRVRNKPRFVALVARG